MLTWMGVQSMMKYPSMKKFAAGFKTTAMLVAAPVIGLFFILAFPLVGLVMLVWTGAKAVKK
jgi:hypothetical protein